VFDASSLSFVLGWELEEKRLAVEAVEVGLEGAK
jgi:hypothetical protein